ncbi:MAG TPA: hypothetical protein PLM07_15265 [Candidatus Rifleibacterium sp.]|nr:hypothetical protein [Candidatus Rifleibacterium sp.]HPT47239.1 hypothetical protein [Candidatus Rifleibacterium sp.]
MNCQKSYKNKFARRHGVAMVMVIGLIAIMMPVIFMLSRIGGSQTQLAIKYHENLVAETVAFSGSNAGLSRLQGNIRGYQDLPDESSGEEKYALNIRPTGAGFFGQTLYFLLTNAKIKSHNYTLMAEAEQFKPEPTPPVLVISRDYWNTVEPYEISLMADVLSMQNYRGMELLRLEETRTFERQSTLDQYKSEMQAKKLRLPAEIQSGWDKIVTTLVDEKISE